MSKTKLIKIGLEALVNRWPMIKSWASLPNSILFEIGLAIIESEESWGELVYLPRYIDRLVDKKLEYNEELYSTRTGRGYVYGDGLVAQYGQLDSIMTIWS